MIACGKCNRTGRPTDGDVLGEYNARTPFSPESKFLPGTDLTNPDARRIISAMYIARCTSYATYPQENTGAAFALKRVGRIAPGKVPDILPRKESYNGTEKQIQP